MEQTEWSTVHRIFSQAVDLAPDERAAYVRAATAELPHVQTAVFALLRADSDAGEYLEDPLVSPHDLERLHRGLSGALQPGTVLAGRFEILREVGAGGMGRVYEALDTEFHTRIAIKTIREDLLSSPDALRRFRHEAQLARRLSHRNICRIHDLERAPLPDAGGGGDLCFITMEFLDGVSVADELSRRGALPLDEAAVIARQVADALDTAHRAGVTHGDLKPANILLCRGCDNLRVVVTDFGLARAHLPEAAHGSNGATSAATRAAAPMGTLAYMAPEQIAGEPSTPATDLYAFGLLLYELLTGRRAFAESNPLKGIADRLTAHPPSPRKERPGIPDGWCLAVAQCLHTAASERPATATAALTLAVESAAARRQRLRNALRIPVRNRKAFASGAAAVILLTVSLFFAISRFYKTEAPGPVEAGARIYMPPVRNLTGNPKLNGVTALLQAALAQSPQFTLLPEADAAQTLQRMMRPPDTGIDETTAREIALRTESQRVVFVTLRNSGNKLQLHVDLQQPDTHTPARPRRSEEHAWTCCAAPSADQANAPSAQGTQTAQGEVPGDLLHIVRDTADWVRHNTGEPAETVRDLNNPVEDITTMSWQALNEFHHAETLQTAGRSEDAILELRSAVQHDPNFALAWARLGDIQCSVGKEQECLQNYEHALSIGDEHRLTRRERNRIRGLHALDSWDFATAAEIFRDTTLYYDHDFLAWFYRGTSLIHTGEIGQAIEALKHAQEARPHSLSANESLASAQLIAGDVAGARQSIANLHRDGYDAAALRLEAEIANLASDDRNARLKLEQAAGQSDSMVRLVARRLLVRLASQRRDAAAAKAAADSYRTEAERQGAKQAMALSQLDEAWLQCADGRMQACSESIEQALNFDRSPYTLRMASEALRAAMVRHAANGDMEVVRKTLLKIMHQVPPEPSAIGSESAHGAQNRNQAVADAQLRGDLLLTQGLHDEARAAYLRAATADTTMIARYRLRRSLELLEGQGPNYRGANILQTEIEKLESEVPAGLTAYCWFTAGSIPVDGLPTTKAVSH